MRYSNRSILVIDDDEATNFITRIVLEDAGFDGELAFFDSAQEALHSLSAPGAQVPDLIFLDINMPGMDGWEFADEFQQLAISSQVRVILFSTSDSPRDRQRAMAHPVILEFLQKPLTPETVSGLLQNYLANAVSR